MQLVTARLWGQVSRHWIPGNCEGVQGDCHPTVGLQIGGLSSFSTLSNYLFPGCHQTHSQLPKIYGFSSFLKGFYMSRHVLGPLTNPRFFKYHSSTSLKDFPPHDDSCFRFCNTYVENRFSVLVFRQKDHGTNLSLLSYILSSQTPRAYIPLKVFYLLLTRPGKPWQVVGGRVG